MFSTNQAKKQVLFLAIFLSITEARIKIENQPLKCILYIQYLFKFKKNHTKFQALIDFASEVNIITLVYMAILELKHCPINVRA